MSYALKKKNKQKMHKKSAYEIWLKPKIWSV